MKKNHYVFLILILLTSTAAYQPIQDDEDLIETFQQINEEVLANSRAYETLGEACKVIGHRLTGSSNGKKAEEYTYNLLKNYGIKVYRNDLDGDVELLSDGINYKIGSMSKD